MAEYATKDDVQKVVDKAVDDLSNIISQFAQSMHNELTDIKNDIVELKATLSLFRADHLFYPRVHAKRAQ